jgi:hypothetical protein
MSRKPTAEDFNRINGSKYLSKDDVGDDEITTAITNVVIEPIRDKDGTTKDKFVVSFDAFDKPLVLNTTNKAFLGEAFGKDANDWVGNRVVVYVDNTVIFNGNRGGVRLRMPPKSPRNMPKRPAAVDADLSEDIPFDR